MREKYPHLTEAESIVMEILWRDEATGSTAILKEIESMMKWSRQTVRTYLKRLEDKGLVGTRETNKRTYEYYPLVSREEYAADKAGSLFNRYYHNLSHMVAGIVQTEKISDTDLEELEALIRKLRNKGGE